ncbi:MAG: Re/Si-specific NAD(P)(+) transhydrogenase subunit alpha [Vicinamibacteria bacterium]|nr:Re/Si-specific NAD(P)(+) transhydrogenase subunit alpha [Vicinamibacteria bacterium]
MRVGVPRETFNGERRVALVPALVPGLTKAGFEVTVEKGAGEAAGFPDAQYVEKGATLGTRDEAFAADIVLQVRAFGANREAGRADLAKLRAGQVLIGFLDPLGAPEAAAELAPTGVTACSMELMPRITRAQSMDALSSMATVAGYRAVLLAALKLPKMFPMLMTAAGTLSPAKVFVIGAGVAGLQAISAARRLGAVVHGYDVRPAAAEQIRSLGAKVVDLGLDTAGSEDKGGYAKAQDEAFYRRQREVMAKVVAESDVVITTAQVPGRKAPILVTAEMVRAMAPGSVVVDLAAEGGDNCELTRAGVDVVEHGVHVLGPVNLASDVPLHASQMYAKNLVTLLGEIVKKGELALDPANEVVAGVVVTRGGEVVHPRVREALAPAGATA